MIVPSLTEESDLSSSDIAEEKPGTGSESESLNFSCDRCGRTYLNKYTIARHLRYECGIPASYPCQFCGRKFKRLDVMKGHRDKCLAKCGLK